MNQHERLRQYIKLLTDRFVDAENGKDNAVIIAAHAVCLLSSLGAFVEEDALIRRLNRDLAQLVLDLGAGADAMPAIAFNDRFPPFA